MSAHVLALQPRFAIRVARIGDKYGRNRCLVAAEPMVEVFDLQWTFDAIEGDLRGQLVTVYYAHTLTKDAARLVGLGLCLDGGVPAWEITAPAMAEVLAFIAGVLGGAL